MIPDISDDRLEELASSIHPLARFVERDGKLEEPSDDELGELFLIEPCDPRNVGFNTDPKPTDRAPHLREVGPIKTLHTISSIFNPSIAEVLAQIPDEYIGLVTHFETVRDFPQPHQGVGEETFYVALTHLYQAV